MGLELYIPYLTLLLLSGVVRGAVYKSSIYCLSLTLRAYFLLVYLVLQPFRAVLRCLEHIRRSVERRWNKWLETGPVNWTHLFLVFCIVMVLMVSQLGAILAGRLRRVLPTALLIYLYSSAPLKSLSRLFGKVNSIEVPVELRTPCFSLYCWLYKLDLSEAVDESLDSYPTLRHLFCRALKPGLRPVHPKAPVTSPADGRVLHLGPVQGDLLEQVKGVTYSLQGFFGPGADGSRELRSSDLVRTPGNVLQQCIIYLAPGDYHRFHSPADWTARHRRHFPGELFSVQPAIARWLKGLFSLNERVVYRGDWQHGFFSMAPVGAVNVGSISVAFDEGLSTNTPDTYPAGTHFDLDLPQGQTMHKGQLIGEFNMGSTVVLIFEAPASFNFRVKPGDKVKVGDAIGF